MSDNPLDRLPSFDRVSIRAVLVRAGEDPSAALAEAGIFDPIAIPVIVGDEHDPSGRILGDGITPNLIGILETERTGDFGNAPQNPTDQTDSRSELARQSEAATTALPVAFGLRPSAPVRSVGVTGQWPNRPAGRYG